MLDHLPSLKHPPLDSPNRAWGGVLEEIGNCMALEANWDGMGAGAIDRAIDNVWPRLVDELRDRGWAPPTSVRPTPDGCLSLEWVLSDSNRLEAELSATQVNWVLSTPDGVEIETELV
jgi:hypothetical protein